MTPAELNQLLSSVRHQKFRGQSQKRLDQINTVSNANIERWSNYTEKQKKAISINRQKANMEKWSNMGTYILRSPGYDLIDYYDYKWKEYVASLGKDGGISGKNHGRNQLGYVSPKVIYQIRYQTKYHNKNYKEKIWQILEPHIKQDSVAPAFHHSCKNAMYKWLTTEKSKSYEFVILEELYNFMDKHLDMKVHRGEIRPHSEKNFSDNTLWWRKQAAGWSIIYVPKKQ